MDGWMKILEILSTVNLPIIDVPFFLVKLAYTHFFDIVLVDVAIRTILFLFCFFDFVC